MIVPIQSLQPFQTLVDVFQSRPTRLACSLCARKQMDFQTFVRRKVSHSTRNQRTTEPFVSELIQIRTISLPMAKLHSLMEVIRVVLNPLWGLIPMLRLNSTRPRVHCPRGMLTILESILYPSFRLMRISS